MSSKPVTDLPAADPLSGDELIHVVQHGSSRKTTAASIGGGAYHYGSFAVAAIGAGEILMDHVVATPHVLAANFAGCVASVGTPPDGNWIADIQKNGVSIGSLTIHPDGTVTWPAVAAVAVAAGDVIALIAPAIADGSIARLRFTFKGSL
jgi:hypothetical protein